ncbi:CbtA family protein [Stappia sp. F7233]|uniref:CbtA family protein n=1 Tax=Stappia albiluteola TaxID=2758565 RepID=A0A839AHV7_9HYPH|nr:CbtA family protein [Stappia albiluteola]MBA5778514.1 CbtA family protein [Stappia albiluteola]
MINRLFGVALGAGLIAGLTLSVLQAFFTVPIILEAETYETASALTPGLQHAIAHANDVGIWLASSGEAHAAHEAAPGFLDRVFGEWAPEDGLERTFYTTVSSLVVGFGFALMALAAMLLGTKRIDASVGLAWGIAGFAAFSLAPSLGLPPEIPGSAAADLAGRQTWWWSTVIATAGGLWLLLASRRGPALKAAGVALILVPHVVGAPHPEAFEATAPAELAGHFAAASLVCSAVFWAVLGSSLGWLWSRGKEEDA